MPNHVSLPSLRGEVHRFCGVVDRFGRKPRQEGTDRKICIRNLRLAEADRALDVDHWWFDLREVWAEAGVRVGDTVLFTVKVTRCTKGWTDPGDHSFTRLNPRRQVIGFATSPRSVVVLRRLQTTNRCLEEMGAQLRQAQAQLAETRAEIERLENHRDALLAEAELQADRLQDRGLLIQSQSSEIECLRHSCGRFHQALVAAVVSGCVLGGGSAWLLRHHGGCESVLPMQKQGIHLSTGLANP
jgi:hypothetical protein